jgi:DNA-directed RNA polymerase subunit RPC12/RpoP
MSYWYCPNCKIELDGCHVTYEEKCEYCGSDVLSVPETISQEELDELIKAKADGRLVVLPCKVGDSIYRPEGLKYSVFWTITNVTIYPDEIVFIDDSDNIFTLDDIGKTVFLTREEAEKAIAEGMK